MRQLYLVGMGPGDGDFIVPKAMQAIAASRDLVAYGLYLQLLGKLCRGKRCHPLPLGEEANRARLALDIAAAGNCTALISGGDIGIYAMASLVFELLDQQLQGKESHPEWLNVDIEVIPGISAMQVAASRVGAILGHDFCAVSLSDLLTSWDIIEKRIHSVGQGDFVVSFYNPVSRKRHWQLNAARDILLKYRSGDTPVLLGRQLTRHDESVIITTLDKLNSETVDMLTLVAVGSSESRHIVHGTKQWVYTPRGYKKWQYNRLLST